MSEALIFAAKVSGSVYFSPALQLHFMCVELQATVLVGGASYLVWGTTEESFFQTSD